MHLGETAIYGEFHTSRPNCGSLVWNLLNVALLAAWIWTWLLGFGGKNCGHLSLSVNQNIRRKMKLWVQRQHLALWRSPCGTQRQARELISDPNLATGARLLSFNRTQSRVVIGVLTRHNTLRRHLHVMGLSNNHTCRKCGTEEETSVYILG